MENKTNEELIVETELKEEEAIKYDKQKIKKIIKRVLIGTGAAAVIGGIIAAMRANAKASDNYCIDGLETEIGLPDGTSEQVETVDSETTEN